ncbi:tripartite tricarboxylate transporter substrate binding protein [Xylophilus rhododendri]|uniref:Tripartite tricarboxylate transporter substrate binding protein n=2 Tax=Xylophilus rhododendri TaxID=2697032 RepID=A0A857JCM1_9BURK|nr:tripartite tricarboxylate transporter substrate binding protein [Xylophilus rhododendri]
MATRLQEIWGQTVLVEYRPGAGLTLGADFVAKSPPDGYTILMAAVHHSIAPAVYRKLPYNIAKDLLPVTTLAIVPNVLIVPASLPANNVQELIALAKARPGALSYGSTGAGTAHHLIGEQFNEMAGTDILHVAYKGSAPAITDMLGGQITMMFDTIPSCLPFIKAGRVKALAVATAKRSATLPEVPTLSEAGLAGFDIATWFGFMVPAGTPASVVEKINRDALRVLGQPETRAQLLAIGADPVGDTPAQMGERISSETLKFKALAAKANLSLD